MKLFIAIFCFICLSISAVAASITFTNLNDPQSKKLFGQLASGQEFDPNTEAQANAAAMSSLLAYMAPSIKNIPGYAGLFAGNCSVFFDNTTINQVGCNIIPVATVSVNETAQINAPTRLPYEYATQITQSHILLASLFGDWSRKIAQKLEQFEVSLFQRAPTCTLSASLTTTPKPTPTGTQVATPTQTASWLTSMSSSQTTSNALTNSVSRTHSQSNSLRATESRSATASMSETGSRTKNQTNSETNSNSASRSQSDYPVCSMNLYTDATHQPARYLVRDNSPNSTVTDLWTGLMWEQVPSKLSMTWPQAQNYCVSLPKGGYSDWRLPSITELQSLVDYTVGNPGPTIDATIFPGTPANQTWTSVSNAGIGGYYWDIEFAYGQISSDSAGNAKAVRCIRGNSLTVSNRYTDENGYTLTNQSTQVRDVLTGLTWERAPHASYVSWNGAQAYCQSLTLGAASWRLPTIKELTSLIDYSSYSPAINSTAFPTPTSNFFWSSTPCIGAATQGWIVSFEYHGLVNYDSTVGDTNHARCVRDAIWASEAYADATNQTKRYVITGNGTNAVVTDTYTRLIWEQALSAPLMTWENATSYCAGLIKGDYGCWRLPTPLELQSLVDFKHFSPAINVAIFPNTPLVHFWSSASGAGTTTIAFVTYSNVGYTDQELADENHSLRCVHGTTSNPAVRYTDENGNQLTSQSIQVKDQSTGLIWQRAQAHGYLSWSANVIAGSAQSYCSNLVIGNHGTGSWCLPQAKELASLLDYTIANPGPTINMTAFPDTSENGYWSSTTYAAFSGNAWNLYFVHPALIYLTTDRAYNVRCVLCGNATSNNGVWSSIAYEDVTNQTARYYVSGSALNAIVTDDFTGLMWEQQVSGSTYFWNASAPAGSAQAYCASLNKGGYTDWRLPTTIELQSLVDYQIAAFEGATPCISSSLPTTPQSYFWSSTNSWWVSFGSTAHYGGLVCFGNCAGVPSLGYVGCVRSGAVVEIIDRYRDDTDNFLNSTSTQVKDIVTNLIWQRDFSVPLNWTLASAFCGMLSIGGYTWRVPTIKELSTLINVTDPPTYINTTAFPNTARNGYWASPDLANNVVYWVVTFSDGTIGHSGWVSGSGMNGNQNYVRCVHR